MIGLAAAVLCALWLVYRDRKLRPMASKELWIPLLWIMVIGSRSVSQWTGEKADPDLASAAFLEGSPLDRNIYLSLIVAGIYVLWRRRVQIGESFRSNRCLFAYFLYFGVSIIWSDYPFVSFKAWIKDLGNLIMVLILITESDYAAATRAVFARYIYFALLVSAALVVFLPDYGGYYNLSNDEFAYCGITTNKNEFGQVLLISGLFLVHDFIERRGSGVKLNMLDLLVRLGLLAIMGWLILLAKSSTSVGTLVIGTLILIAMRFSAVRRQVRYLGMYSVGMVLLIVFINIPIVLETLVAALGRDMTFTGRTEIWERLLDEPINPIVGQGFHSFWLQPGKMESYGFISQAHNGYLETYLNGGWTGLLLLFAFIISVGVKVKKQVLEEKPLSALFFTFLIVSVFVNLTEAMFDKLNILWFVFLLASFEYPLALGSDSDDAAEPVVPLNLRERFLQSRAEVRCGNGR